MEVVSSSHHLHAHIFLWDDGDVSLRVSIDHPDYDGSMTFRRTLSGQDSLPEGVDDLARLMSAWAAFGALGAAMIPGWRSY